MQATLTDVSTKKSAPAAPKKALKKPITTLKINEFGVEVDLAHQNACGGTTEDGIFYVECRLSARELDANGFVIEVDAFKDQVWGSFDRGMIKASCEELAGAVINVACREIGPRLVRAVVEVTNHTGSVEMVWHKGEEIPPFPRFATNKEKQATLEDRERGVKPEPC